VLLDLRMPGIDGFEVFHQAHTWDCSLPIIILTAYGNIRDAVQLIKAGAYDYLTKPFSHRELLAILQSACKESRNRRTDKKDLRKIEDTTSQSLTEKMGNSERIKQLQSEVECVAPTDFAVLITGETGVGKELVAKAIHDHSTRNKGPFVPVDCGAIPSTLIESELFGYEKGAFTGADKRRLGKFEAAENGTLFLDEIGNLPLEMQSRLLRALQEKQIFRVGGVNPIAVNLRIVAATNEALDPEGREGAFRLDLYHRLGEYIIEIPPLRERKEDILFLAKYFIELTSHELGKEVCKLTEEAQDLLLAYDWPGNVRELRNSIRKAVLLCDTDIMGEHLNIRRYLPTQKRNMLQQHSSSDEWKLRDKGEFSLRDIVQHNRKTIEINIISEVLQMNNGNMAATARTLQVDYKTIFTKVKQYGLQQLCKNDGNCM
jgi:two-component system nitrogen regulation response regulator GlnG